MGVASSGIGQSGQVVGYPPRVEGGEVSNNKGLSLPGVAVSVSWGLGSFTH